MFLNRTNMDDLIANDSVLFDETIQPLTFSRVQIQILDVFEIRFQRRENGECAERSFDQLLVLFAAE